MYFETSIDIAAPPERVWAVMTDVERWPEWTASIKSIERLDGGDFGIGSCVRIKQPRLPTTIWQVISYEPERSFEWQARAPGSRVTGSHSVAPAPGGSRATLSIDQSGPVGVLFGVIYRKLTREYVLTEARSLKQRSEPL